MKIAVIRIRPEPHYRREAFESGLRRHGYTFKGHATPSGPNDLLVLWNRKKGIDERDAIVWEQQGGTVLVAENGYLQKTDKTIYAISVGQHNGGGWFPVGSEDRFSALGFEVKPWRKRGGHILLCAQRGIGSSLMASPPYWADKQQVHIKRMTQRAVRLRAHPGNFEPKVPLEQDLASAHACVIWHSAAGVRALLDGVPVFYAAPFWVCEAAALKYVKGGSLETPLCDDAQRQAALHRMSHGQWTVNEIASGEPFARMKAEEWGKLPCLS